MNQHSFGPRGCWEGRWNEDMFTVLERQIFEATQWKERRVPAGTVHRDLEELDMK